MIFLCRSLTNITCESLLISVQGIEELDLIFLAAKNPLVKNFLCVCVCVYVRVHVWECCSVFPSCLSNRKLMLGSTEDKEEAFSFLCESFETERKKIKKGEERGGGKEPGLLHWFSPLRSFLPLPVFTFCTDWLFQLYFLTLCVIFTPATHQCWGDLWVYREAMSCVRGPGRRRK